jgi:hypothetical protein
MSSGVPPSADSKQTGSGRETAGAKLRRAVLHSCGAGHGFGLGFVVGADITSVLAEQTAAVDPDLVFLGPRSTRSPPDTLPCEMTGRGRPSRLRQTAAFRASMMYGVVVATALSPRRTRIGIESGEVSSRMNR